MSKYAKPFQFKQFSIEHDKCAMKVGFDGALLAAWVSSPNPIKILDIGTGSGLIPMMLRQKFPLAKITTIDPNSNAIKQAKINFNNSPFENGFELIKTSLQDFEPTCKFDLILSNPPFFTEETGSDDEDRNQARQEKFLPLTTLLQKAKVLLSDSGIFYLIYPTWESERVEAESKKLNLSISKQTKIFSSQKKASKRTIFEFTNQTKKTIYQDFISGNQDIGYTNEYQELLKDFYIIF